MKEETEPKKENRKLVSAFPPIYNNVEKVTLGSFTLQSEILSVDVLLSLLLKGLENKDIRQYLGLDLNSDQKKVMGGIG